MVAYARVTQSSGCGNALFFVPDVYFEALENKKFKDKYQMK